MSRLVQSHDRASVGEDATDKGAVTGSGATSHTLVHIPSGVTVGFVALGADEFWHLSVAVP